MVWVVVVMSAVATFGCARSLQAPVDGLSGVERVELARLSADAVTAVLDRNMNWLVAHARRDLRDPAALPAAMRIELERYLFRDVRSVFTAARTLEVRVRTVGTDQDGTRWAEVVFFDRAAVTDDELGDPDFLCREDLKSAVVWTFRRAEDGWESLGYPFDAFTDIHCPPD